MVTAINMCADWLISTNFILFVKAAIVRIWVSAVARCAAQVVVLEMSPGMSRPNGVDQVSRSPAAMAECPILNTAWKP